MNKKVFFAIFLCIRFIYAESIDSDLINIKNQTSEDFFVAVYYVKGGLGEKVSDIYVLNSEVNIDIKRPPKKVLYDRNILFTTTKSKLKDKLDKDEVKNIQSFNIGRLKGSKFAIKYNITVYNMSKNSDIYVASYYVKNKEGTRVGDVFEISPMGQEIIRRPKRKLLPSKYDRVLVFSEKMDDLKPKLEQSEYISLETVNIGELRLNKFYIIKDKKKGILKGFNSIEWKFKPVKDKMKSLSSPLIIAIRLFLYNHPYSNKITDIRLARTLPSVEIDFLNTRKQKIQKALEKLFNINLTNKKLPTIALCASGGGYRAMISTAGLFKGIEAIGILDAITYASCLSGSTWFVFPWMRSNQSLDEYISALYTKTNFKDLNDYLKENPLPTMLPILKNVLIPKVLYNQNISLVDVYGGLLAEVLFNELPKEERQKVLITDLAKDVEKGIYPMPIGTAVNITTTDYFWFEFTPYEIGTTYLNAFCPSWGFGRRFIEGKSVNYPPELSLGYMLGIFGSAFNASIEDVVMLQAKGIKLNFLRDLLLKIPQKTDTGDYRIFPVDLPNITYKISGDVADNKFKNVRDLKLGDGGIAFNLPTPPLLRPERRVDIIIIFDASAGIPKGSNELKKAEQWARRNKLPFPPIDYAEAHKKPVSIFEASGAPTIIYIPLIGNESYFKKNNLKPIVPTKRFGTFNFKYSKEDINILSGLVNYNIVENKDIILDSIKRVIDRKR